MGRIQEITGATGAQSLEKGISFKSDQGFSRVLKDFVSKVDAQLKEADQKAVAFAVEKRTDLHEVMVAAAKADITLRLLVRIRNKLVEAYQEIMRMQL